jgi:hypothetical protein
MKEKSVRIFGWRHLWRARVSIEGADTTSYWFQTNVNCQITSISGGYGHDEHGGGGGGYGHDDHGGT